MSPARPFTRMHAGLGLVVLTVAGAPTLATAAVERDHSATARAEVIVQAVSPAAAAAAVRDAGGSVTRALPIVSGVAADVPTGRLADVRAASGVRAVSPDEKVHVAAAPPQAAVRTETLPTETADDTSVSSVYAREVRANRLWNEQVDGSGVRVALVDTGVTQVPDLADRLVRVADPNDPNSLADCVNFSGEDTCDDSYGHGTFMAGLVAGTGASSDGRYKGVAPRAEIVSVKIGGRDGSSDVSALLAAIQWVVSFADEYDIRVLNLSLGTDSPVSYRFSPLNYAVERAWRSGVAVVVSASNRGPEPRTISKPADDPLVITVGAVDDRETTSVGDDTLPDFSGRGPTFTDGLAKPDLVAPGARVVSLRSPGSYIEENAPGGVDATYRRGSGTSMSAAVVSGAAALALQANPGWTPDRLKFALMSTTRPAASTDPHAVGTGLVDVWSAARHAPDGLANTDVVVLADGTGSLEEARGSLRVTAPGCLFAETFLDPLCAVLNGAETQARDATWNGAAFVQSEWSGRSWHESAWAGRSWHGTTWYGRSWHGTSWSGATFYGEPDGTDYGTPVPGSAWYGAWG